MEKERGERERKRHHAGEGVGVEMSAHKLLLSLGASLPSRIKPKQHPPPPPPPPPPPLLDLHLLLSCWKSPFLPPSLPSPRFFLSKIYSSLESIYYITQEEMALEPYVYINAPLKGREKDLNKFPSFLWFPFLLLSWCHPFPSRQCALFSLINGTRRSGPWRRRRRRGGREAFSRKVTRRGGGKADKEREFGAVAFSSHSFLLLQWLLFIQVYL